MKKIEIDAERSVLAKELRSCKYRQRVVQLKTKKKLKYPKQNLEKLGAE